MPLSELPHSPHVLCISVASLPFPSLYEIAMNGRISVTDCRRLLSECHELLCTMADFAHGRCTKLLGFRAKVCTCVHTIPTSTLIHKYAHTYVLILQNVNSLFSMYGLT